MSSRSKRLKAIVLAGQTGSGAVEVGSVAKMLIKCPLAVAVTFNGAFDAGLGANGVPITPTWFPLRDAAGAAVGLTTVAGSAQVIPNVDALLSCKYIQVVIPIQGSDTTIEFPAKLDQ